MQFQRRLSHRLPAGLLALAVVTTSCSPPSQPGQLEPSEGERDLLRAVEEIVAATDSLELIEQGRSAVVAKRLQLLGNSSVEARRAMAQASSSPADEAEHMATLGRAMASALVQTERLQANGATLDLSRAPSLRAGLAAAPNRAGALLTAVDAARAKRLLAQAQAQAHRAQP